MVLLLLLLGGYLCLGSGVMIALEFKHEDGKRADDAERCSRLVPLCTEALEAVKNGTVVLDHRPKSGSCCWRPSALDALQRALKRTLKPLGSIAGSVLTPPSLGTLGRSQELRTSRSPLWRLLGSETSSLTRAGARFSSASTRSSVSPSSSSRCRLSAESSSASSCRLASTETCAG